MKTERPTCETCIYWDGDAETRRGDCRIVSPSRRQGSPARPAADYWCGEHPGMELARRRYRLEQLAGEEAPIQVPETPLPGDDC